MNMSYTKLLDMGNKFFEDSGLRRYCQEKCRGKCCMNSFDTKPGHREKRFPNCNSKIKCQEKLPCVMFMCGTLYRLIHDSYAPKRSSKEVRAALNNLAEAQDLIVSKIHEELSHRNDLRWIL